MRQPSFSKTPKIIGFDMDGVIIDHTDLKISLVSSRGFNLSKAQVQGDVIENILPKPVFTEVKNFLYNDPKTALSQPIMAGALAVLRVLKSSGALYFLVSRRKNPQMAIELLKARGLWPDYFNKDNAFFILTREDKNIKAKDLGITHYIDDEPSVLEKLVDVPNKFLFDPYGAFVNQNVYKRLSSWGEGIRELV